VAPLHLLAHAQRRLARFTPALECFTALATGSNNNTNIASMDHNSALVSELSCEAGGFDLAWQMAVETALEAACVAAAEKTGGLTSAQSGLTSASAEATERNAVVAYMAKQPKYGTGADSGSDDDDDDDDDEADVCTPRVGVRGCPVPGTYPGWVWTGINMNANVWPLVADKRARTVAGSSSNADTNAAIVNSVRAAGAQQKPRALLPHQASHLHKPPPAQS